MQSAISSRALRYLKISIFISCFVSALVTIWWWKQGSGIYLFLANKQIDLFGFYMPFRTAFLTFAICVGIIFLPLALIGRLVRVNADADKK